MKLAIDPGSSGALAVEDEHGDVWSYKCPDTQTEMFELLKETSQLARIEGWPIKAVIEKVHSMPGQGVVSVWKFSANYASWQMALIALEIPFEEVRPQEWMKKLGGVPKDKKERKNYIKDKMQKKYPKEKVTLANADALGILSVMD